VDTVSSDYLFRDAAGTEYKPADYLEQFARFVRENPNRIEAIQILLDRPRGWNTEALKELRAKLSTAPLRFTPDNLEKAHRIRYSKALVDIISMVKHAARENSPLLTAPERVDRAFERLTAGRSFTSEQHAWLGRIRAHLVPNLSIERDDFDIVPILSNPGGWGGANRAFDGKLAELVAEINEALAA
jgi:type I restriction enzyme, R subunit